MKLLQDRFAEAAEGEERLISAPVSGFLRRQIEANVKAAGVETWADVFQTLRRSCEKLWAMEGVPQFAVVCGSVTASP